MTNINPIEGQFNPMQAALIQLLDTALPGCGYDEQALGKVVSCRIG